MIRYAEFCAGIGGFKLGIEKSDLDSELVYSNEIDLSCEKTYLANYGQGFDSRDVFDIVSSELPDFDMLCAGFPCQPFSLAGKEKGFEDPRGTIIFKLFDIIEAKHPAIVFLENVPNLERHDNGNTFRFIREKLELFNYSFLSKTLDSTFFGIPQSRPRIYMIGISRVIYPDAKFAFTTSITARTPLRAFLNSGDYSIPISNRWQEYIDLYVGKKDISEMSFTPPKTRKTLERASTNCDLQDCVFQIRSSGIRAYSIDEPFPTFAVSNSGGGAMIPVLSKERRHFNLTEMRRIMGFPEDFILSEVSRTEAIKQLANAVCPPVIASICNDIKRAIVE